MNFQNTGKPLIRIKIAVQNTPHMDRYGCRLFEYMKVERSIPWAFRPLSRFV